MTFSLPDPPVGMSRELIEHHGRLHEAECLRDRPAPTGVPIGIVCPCGSCMVLICQDCSRPVYVLAVPGAALCACARGALDPTVPEWFGAAEVGR